jgi:hypothetical protein
VRRWRLTPRVVDGQPTSSVGSVDVSLVLDNDVIKAKQA